MYLVDVADALRPTAPGDALADDPLSSTSGRCERAHTGHTQHLQRAVSVPHLLAHLRHHGRAAIQRPLPQGEK